MLVEGVKVKFMRIDGAKLDPGDSYESEWCGGGGGNGELIGGDGSPVVGIYGRNADALDKVGLIQRDDSSP
jgi:hypothetical protein